MKKQTRRLLSTVLTATTIMSMLTAVPAGAVDELTEESGQLKNEVQGEAQGKVSNTITDENNIHQMGQTGDRTLEYDIPDDVTVINSVRDYYSVRGKKYRQPSGSSASASLPSSADNSQSIYFPPIGDQKGVGACASWAQGYYQFTYTMNKEMGIPTTPENVFSPKWTYNLGNGGEDIGSISDYLYYIMKWQGVAQMSVVPYDDDYLSWSPTEEAWSNAIKYKLKDYQQFDDVGKDDSRITSVDDSDLDVIKTALSNGDVLTYSTCIYSWKSTKLKANPMAPENDKYIGEEVVTAQEGYNGAHRMTLVGYNDNIWTDINNNNVVDTGEMGAFKIANSWGESYCNDGFAWVAYDALNAKTSSVNGAPAYSNKAPIFGSVARIDVEPVKDNSDMYLKCTLNTSNRAEVDVYLIAEKNGTVYEELGFATTKHNIGVGKFAFDGTTNSTDGTLAFALNNVTPDISSENFHEYNWSVRFVDEENDGTVLTVKDVAIVDAGENKTYKVDDFTEFTLDGEERTVDITSTTLNDVVIYYLGYYNPTLHYMVEGGEWQTAQMQQTAERYGYTHKYIIPSDDIKNVKLYFTDKDGTVDDNNGKYYNAGRRLNYYVTENQAKPLSANVKVGSVPDVNKYMDYIATAQGGYAPYRYEFTFTKLDDGKEYVRAYEHNDTASWYIRYEGDYRITVNVKDQSNKVVTASLDFYAENVPFEFSSFTASPDKQIMTGDTVEFTAVTDFESIISWGYKHSMYDFTIKNTDTDEVVYYISKRSDKAHMGYRSSTIYLSWVPTKPGNYLITVSSTDGGNQYAEKSNNFNVTEYNGTIIGDADNNKQINVTDALLVMKYNISSIDSAKLWLALCDCNKDGAVDIKDVICILRYTVSSGNYAYAGEVNYKEMPTEPPTEAPTQKPTEKPTEAPTVPVEENIVTFSNSYNWGGTIYCYYWSDTNKSMIAWPGKPMTQAGTNSQGQALYTFKVPDEATYIIFSNGSTQTVDIPYAGGEVKYYPTTTNSKGHYNVSTWT